MELLGVLADGHEVRLTFSGPPRVKDAVSQHLISQSWSLFISPRACARATPSRSPSKPELGRGSSAAHLSSPATPAPMEALATIAAYASSAFILVPAGRDMLSHGTALLPGEENVRPLMTMTGAAAREWMWGVWGLNHCLISLLKILAVRNADRPMLKLLAASALATAYYCALGQGAHGDMEGFIAVCAVQVASLGYLGFAAQAPKAKGS